MGVSTTHPYNVWAACDNTRNRESLDIPPSKTKSGQRPFLHIAVNIWNNLDKDFKKLSIPSLKKVENAHARELF